MTQSDNSIRLLDVVALIDDLTDKGLLRGQVGTVVDVLAPSVFEVEFSGDDGRAYALTTLRSSQLLVLHYEPRRAA